MQKYTLDKQTFAIKELNQDKSQHRESQLGMRNLSCPSAHPTFKITLC